MDQLFGCQLARALSQEVLEGPGSEKVANAVGGAIANFGHFLQILKTSCVFFLFSFSLFLLEFLIVGQSFACANLFTYALWGATSNCA